MVAHQSGAPVLQLFLVVFSLTLCCLFLLLRWRKVGVNRNTTGARPSSHANLFHTTFLFSRETQVLFFNIFSNSLFIFYGGRGGSGWAEFVLTVFVSEVGMTVFLLDFNGGGDPTRFSQNGERPHGLFWQLAARQDSRAAVSRAPPRAGSTTLKGSGSIIARCHRIAFSVVYHCESAFPWR
jgi:hypothetical protein